MIIILENHPNVRIEADSNGNYIPQYKSIVQAGRLTKEENVGKERWYDLGYHTTIPSALNKLIKHLTEDGVEEIDLVDLIEKRQQIKKGINILKLIDQ